MKHPSFNVAPRYSGGSPAMVDERTARRVAEEEKHSFQSILKGREGEERMLRAQRLGLRGIAEQRVEKGAGKKQGWEVVDLCTGEVFFRLCSEALRKLGWAHYADLPPSRRALVDRDPPPDIEDPKKGWYKFKEAIVGGLRGHWDWEITLYRPQKRDTGDDAPVRSP